MQKENSVQPILRGTSEIPIWRDERYLRAAAQIISAILIIGFVFFVIINFFNAAENRGLPLGYDFLSESAGFPITESTIAYDPGKSFGYAFLAGVVNTLRVAIVGILLATILGTIVGIARLSTNWLVSKIALVYIEFHRNIPLLVLLFIWFFASIQRFPDVENSITLPGPIFLNQRGVYMAWLETTPTTGVWIIFLAVGMIGAIIAWRVLLKIRETTGQPTYFVGVSLTILILLPLIGWIVVGDSPFTPNIPELKTFNFSGGLRLTPEFTALLIGLVMYTAAFIAEVVRAGIQSVSRGQLEAAQAIGLKPFQVLGLVIIPQALRVIVPPLISQYLNLTKNSSLALAIGYPDLFNVGRIMINQAGRAVPVFSMIMISYLAMSLFTSFVLNIYNRRIQLVER
jgi:general L-amino acid transport system permease protein